MYSLVVLMALGTAGEAPEWGCGWGGYGGYCGGYSYCGGWGGWGGYCGGYYGGHCGYGYAYCAPVYSHCYAPVVYSHCAPVYCYPHIIPATPKKDDKKKPKDDEVSTQATIVVNVPAEAKLTFDGAVTTSTSTRRVFVTPELKPGTEYSYVVKVEVTRDGKPVVDEKKVTFKAGETAEVTLGETAAGVASR